MPVDKDIPAQVGRGEAEPSDQAVDVPCGTTRRQLLGRGSLLLGGLVFRRLAASSVLCPAVVDAATAARNTEKEGLRVLTDLPLNAETPAHLLDPVVTSIRHFFVRNNGHPPQVRAEEAGAWSLTVAGEACRTPRTFSLEILKAEFEHQTLDLVVECAGNGRREFSPQTPGNQWSVGAVGCARWTGVRLRDVLQACGITDAAEYVAYEGSDQHLSRAPGKLSISRGVPLAKALEDESLIAWNMNGEPLPSQHGYPLRLVIGGWPGSVSGKWLRKILIRDREHDGPKMEGLSYRVPCAPVPPGHRITDEPMCIIESMPVKSLITSPESGSVHTSSEPVTVRGHAWAGDRQVIAVHVSRDYGTTWTKAELSAPTNRLAWWQWSLELPAFPTAGYYEIWARATDDHGAMQPMVLPGWNPKGYLNNACHRVAVDVV